MNREPVEVLGYEGDVVVVRVRRQAAEFWMKCIQSVLRDGMNACMYA